MRRLLLGVVLCVAVTGCIESPLAPKVNDGCTSTPQPDGSIEHGCPGR